MKIVDVKRNQSILNNKCRSLSLDFRLLSVVLQTCSYLHGGAYLSVIWKVFIVFKLNPTIESVRLRYISMKAVHHCGSSKHLILVNIDLIFGSASMNFEH